MAYNKITVDGKTPNSTGEIFLSPNVTEIANTQTDDYDISSYTGIEEVFIFDVGASINVNLPSASTVGEGYKYQLKNISTYTLTIDPNSTQTIDSSTTVDINTQYASLTIVSNGTNKWFII